MCISSKQLLLKLYNLSLIIHKHLLILIYVYDYIGIFMELDVFCVIK